MSESEDCKTMEVQHAPSCNSSNSEGGGVRFEIKKWNAVTMWSWNISAEHCAICRNTLHEPSIEYQVLKYELIFILYSNLFFI
jgi:RING-box protein 1